ncbi:Hpt domain-containing protein [Granulosicoccus sp. 3-233]|uniref:Hpt domain-containing protein n=1 Tax=Granulosicoccus sp. 3-233 TaxID=3417969 RepID=UPI003D327EAD
MTSYIEPQALKSIASLQRPGKPDLLERVVGLFKSESPTAIEAIQQGLDSDDLPAVGNAAHGLKSSSAYVGARMLSERCRELEAAAREENHPACHALADGVEELFEASIVALDQHMRKVA